MQSFRLTKTLWIIKFHHKPKIRESTTCHQISFPHESHSMGLSPSYGSKLKAATLLSPSRHIKNCHSTRLQQTSGTCSLHASSGEQFCLHILDLCDLRNITGGRVWTVLVIFLLAYMFSISKKKNSSWGFLSSLKCQRKLEAGLPSGNQSIKVRAMFWATDTIL